MTSLRQDEQLLSLDAIVSLMTLDTTGISTGGQVLRYTPGPLDGGDVTYQGRVYRPLPVRLSGVRSGGRNSNQPRLEVAATDMTLLTIVTGREDLRGATVHRLRTLKKYLDGQPSADPERHWPEETWLVDQLLERHQGVLRWQLASPLLWDTARLPGRQALRDVCPWTYRRWRDGAWDYTGVTCPYRGDDYYDARNQPVTDATEDRCSRRISGCRARYPLPTVLPFGGFAGLNRRA